VGAAACQEAGHQPQCHTQVMYPCVPAGSRNHRADGDYVGSAFAASLTAATSCATVGAPAAPSGVEYIRDVNPPACCDDSNGSRPSRSIDGDPPKRYPSVSVGSLDADVFDCLREPGQAQGFLKTLLHQRPMRTAIELEQLNSHRAYHPASRTFRRWRELCPTPDGCDWPHLRARSRGLLSVQLTPVSLIRQQGLRFVQRKPGRIQPA